MKTPRLALVAVLAAATLVLSTPESHASSAVATPYVCSGAVLFNVSIPGGWWSTAPLAYACNGSLRQVYALGNINGSSFTGTYYDGVCSGNVSGAVVGSGSTATLNGLLTNVTCAGVGGRTGPFSVSGTFPAGVMTAVIS